MLNTILSFFNSAGGKSTTKIQLERQKFQVDFVVSSQNDQLTWEKDISSVTFYNRGNTPVLLNNVYEMDPGEFIVIPCEWNEEDTTKYFWSFPPNSIASPVNKFVVVRKTFR